MREDTNLALLGVTGWQLAGNICDGLYLGDSDSGLSGLSSVMMVAHRSL